MKSAEEWRNDLHKTRRIEWDGSAHVCIDDWPEILEDIRDETRKECAELYRLRSTRAQHSYIPGIYDDILNAGKKSDG